MKQMETCKKCNKDGNRFVKLYDTAIGGYGVQRHKTKGVGKWVKCKYCLGVKKPLKDVCV